MTASPGPLCSVLVDCSVVAVRPLTLWRIGSCPCPIGSGTEPPRHSEWTSKPRDRWRPYPEWSQQKKKDVRFIHAIDHKIDDKIQELDRMQELGLNFLHLPMYGYPCMGHASPAWVSVHGPCLTCMCSPSGPKWRSVWSHSVSAAAATIIIEFQVCGREGSKGE